MRRSVSKIHKILPLSVHHLWIFRKIIATGWFPHDLNTSSALLAAITLRIVYGLPWMSISCHESGDSEMISTSNEITSENRCRISSRETKNRIHGNPCIIFISYTLFSALIEYTNPLNNDRLLISPFSPRTFFLKWHCDIATFQSVTSRERDVLALWRHIPRLFLRVQNEGDLHKRITTANIYFPPPGIHGLVWKQRKQHH